MQLAFIVSFAAATEPGLFHRLLFRDSLRTPVARPTSHPEYMYSALQAENLRSPQPGETFDYIVVGGGGAGCPFARTLADAGHKVLLLERGGLREFHPVTWDLKGTGATLMDAAVSQPIVTTEGYISHIGHVLGGGTAVNLGFYIEGNDNNFTRQFARHDLWQEATRWVREKVANPAKHKKYYNDQIAEFMAEVTKNQTIGLSYEYNKGANWRGASIYDEKDDFRFSADTMLGPVPEFPPSLTLSIHSKAEKIKFVRDSHTRVLKAHCVEFHSTFGSAAALLGRKESVAAAMQNEASLRSWFDWYPNIVKFLGSLFTPSSEKSPTTTVCLNDSADSEIVLSAGAILTPGLLYASGVGPISQTSRLGVVNLLDLKYLGQYLGDRVFLPIAFFFRDHIKDKFIPAVVQRLALWEPNPAFTTSIKQQMLQRSEEYVPFANETVRTRMSELDDLLNHSVKVEENDASLLRDENSLSWTEVAEQGKLSLEGLFSDSHFGSSPNHTSLQDSSESFAPVLAGLEELSGGMMTTGCGVATRYFFPPQVRSSIAVDVALDTLFGCATLERTSKAGLLSLCPLVKPILECFRKTAVLIYMMPQPKSVGSVQVGGPDGKTLAVTGNYLVDEADIRAGTLGLAALLQALQATKAFDQTFELTDTADDKCPALIRNSMSSLLYHITDLLIPYVGLQEAEGATAALGARVRESYSDAVAALERPISGAAVREVEEDDSRPQKFSSFPAVLPDPTDYAAVRRFLLRHSTSMWHWHGSARIGLVVDDDLRVAGTERLAIVDASVIGELPKMNPQVAVMILGRYAAALRLSRRNKFTN